MITLMLAILAAWFVALFLGPAIYAAMGLAGFAFLFLTGIPGIVVPQKIAMAANSFPLLAAPLFILMGNVMNSAGISYRIFDFATALVGWQFGVVFVLNLMIGTITPPVGVVLYVTAKVANVSCERMSRAVLPYLIPLIAVLMLITVWPPLTLWLPGWLLAK